VGKIVDLHDGDTCRIAIPLYGTLQKMTCRLLGVDTPEMAPPISSPTRETEILAAHRARNFLLKIATNCADEIDIGQKLTRGQVAAVLRNNTKIISVVCGEFDKYGRLLVELYDCPATSIESAGVSYNQRLIQENYAKPYFGGTKEKFDE
jgi:endonuclease YncB( thermonuclease family)